MTATLAPSPWPAPAVAARTAVALRRESRSKARADAGHAVGAEAQLLVRAAPHAGRVPVAVRAVAGHRRRLLVAGRAGGAAVRRRSSCCCSAWLWVYARHAADGETITLADRELTVEHRCGAASTSARFRAEWVRVEPAHGDGSLVEVCRRRASASASAATCGPSCAPQLAQELRQALRLRTHAHGDSKQLPMRTRNDRRTMDIAHDAAASAQGRGGTGRLGLGAAGAGGQRPARRPGGQPDRPARRR